MTDNQFLINVVNNYIKPHEQKLLQWLDDQIDLIVMGSFDNEDTTLEEATKNANDFVNSMINKKISEKLGIDENVVSIAFQSLIDTKSP